MVLNPPAALLSRRLQVLTLRQRPRPPKARLLHSRRCTLQAALWTAAFREFVLRLSCTKDRHAEGSGVEFIFSHPVVGRSRPSTICCSATVLRHVGSGAGLPTFIGVPGENANGVYSANEYLTRINLMKAYKDNSDTPIYHAKSRCCRRRQKPWTRPLRAKRMGANEVYRNTAVPRRSFRLVSRRFTTRRKRALCSKFLTRRSRCCLTENFNVTGLRCQQMELGEPDASGRRRPIPVEGAQRVIDLDCVIAGDRYQPEPLHPPPWSETNHKGCIVADDEHGITLG